MLQFKPKATTHKPFMTGKSEAGEAANVLAQKLQIWLEIRNRIQRASAKADYSVESGTLSCLTQGY